METNSVVKSVQANGIFENTYNNAADLGGGKKGYFKFDYEMEDGTSIAANHTHNDPFKEGTQVTYLVKGSNNFGSYGSVGKLKESVFASPQAKSNEPTKPSDVQTYIIRQSSLKIALDYLAVQPDWEEAATKENVTEYAEYFTNYVLKGL